jgi:hypothetical protein
MLQVSCEPCRQAIYFGVLEGFTEAVIGITLAMLTGNVIIDIRERMVLLGPEFFG